MLQDKSNLMKKQVKENKIQIETILQNAPEAVIIIDEKGIITEWNPQAENIFGWKKKEITGKHLHQIIIPSRYRNSYLKGLTHFLKTGKGHALNKPLELVALRKDNTEFSAGLNISPFLFEGNQFFIGFISDISDRKTAEAKLKESEQKLAASERQLNEAQHLARMGSWEMNMETNEVIWSEEMYSIYGYGKKRFPVTFTKATERMLPKDASDTRLRMKKHIEDGLQAFKEKGVLEFESPLNVYTIVLPDGSKKNLQGIGKIILNSEGKITKMIGTVQDITGQKKIEEETKESRERFKKLFDFMPYPCWVYDVKTLRFLEINHAAINHYGYSREEFLTMHLTDIRPKEEVARLIKNIEQRKAEVQSTGGWKHRLRNGQLIDVEITSHLLDYHGRPAALVIANDITARKKAEEQLRFSEEKFNKAFQLSPAGISLFRLDNGKIIDVNESYLKMIGYKREEVVGRSAVEIGFLDPAERKKLEDEFSKNGSLTNHELVFIKKSGEKGNALFSVESILIKGEPCVISVIYDITKRKKAEEQLKSTLAQLSEAQQMAQIGSWEWNIQANTISWSEELYRIYGLQPNEFSVTFGSAEKYTHPEDKEYVHKITVPAYRDKKAFFVDYRIIRTDGEVRTLNEQGKVINDAAGNPVKMLGTVHDITERKKAEELIKQSEEKFNKAFQLSPSGITLTSLNTGKWIDVNESFLKMTEYSRGEVIGHTSSELEIISAEDREKLLEEINKAGSVRNKEVEFKKKSGEKGISLFSNETILLKNEQIILSILYEITDRKKTETALQQKSEELAKSNKELEQFAYIASHDLKEPLRTVSNYVDLFETQYKGKLDENADIYLNFIKGATSRMQTLISDLLEYSRIGSNKNITTIDCNEMVGNLLNDMKASIAESGGKINFKNLPVINAYPDLKSLFQNLIGNAVKFRKGSEKLVINITAKDKGKEWLFAIQDNGIGIEKKYYDRIFIIFQRLHSKEEYAGTGIGLAQCKKIIELHNGKIWIESELGKGSTFYFTIPKMI